jgi:quercetin dioxygenase-like cupin family protein
MKLKLLIGSIAAVGAAIAQTSKVPIENDQVKVLLVDVQPHVKTKLHEHTVNRVMVYLQPGKQEFDYQGGKKSELTWKAGEAKWSPAAGMHVAEIVSGNPVTIAEIELKKTGVKGTSASAALDPAKIDPKHYHVEFENDQVRVLRVRIPSHQSTPVHTHVLNRVIVYLTDQDIQVTTTDGKSDRLHHKQGEVSWGGPATHKEENMSDHLFEVIAVEIKN